MTRYLALVNFLLIVFVGALHARSLERQQLLDADVGSHYGESQQTSCPPGMCLSQYNYCGTDDRYCGQGCQAGPCYAGSFNGDGDLPPASSNGDVHSGDGTFYDPGLGACGTNNNRNEFVAALAALDFDPHTPQGNPNRNNLCGRRISVTGPQGTITVEVVDRCYVCQKGDLNLSPAAFGQIGDIVDGRIHINWRYV